MFEVDWSRMLMPSASLAEIAIRGTIIYLALFATMRLLPRREIGGMGPSDILVIVLIADAVQNGMSGGYESVTEAILLAAVIFSWASLIDWIDYRFPKWHLGEASPMMLIRDGRFVPRAMKRDNVSEDELMAQLRLHGLDSVTDVAAAYIEGDGRFSVILRGKRARRAPPSDEQRK